MAEKLDYMNSRHIVPATNNLGSHGENDIEL